MNKSILNNTLLFLLSMALMVIIGESFIRLASFIRPIYNIEMVKYAKALKMADPLGEVSHIHRQNTSAKLMGVTISLNNLGNRGKELSTTKSQNTKRILIMGSSVTLGWGVSQEETFTSILEQRLNKEKTIHDPRQFEVINAGIGNYNSYYQYRLFLRQYSIVQPDMVIFHYFINDAEKNPQRNDNPLLKHSLLFAFLYDKIALLAFQHKGNKPSLFEFYQQNYQEDNADFQRSIQSILSVKKICEDLHIPFALEIVPDFHNLQMNSPYESIYQLIEKTYLQHNIPVINTFKNFQLQFGGKEKELWIQPDDPHPNQKGHRVMADEIYPYIKNHFFKGNGL
ncbi:MAG: SGNH/GDSL hydrolase family protein [Oligoflexia bacterium]|nr:SGNH/GDSL hydrolase family protein [Oligoflexia bacterium]